jgi:hypothetical protein
MDYLIGGLIGFTVFVFELESDDMGGIIFRTNSDGKKVFSPDSILEIMKAPFKFTQFWINKDLLKVNWIFMSILGMIIAKIYDKMILE